MPVGAARRLAAARRVDRSLYTDLWTLASTTLAVWTPGPVGHWSLASTRRFRRSSHRRWMAREPSQSTADQNNRWGEEFRPTAVTRWAKARAGSVSNKRWLDELLAPVPGRRPERFADSFVISVMSQNPPRPKKNEL